MTSMTASAPSRPTGALHIALWVVQVLLAAAFLGAGLLKATTPIAELGQKMDWVLTSPEALVRFIGISEIAGALGMILPSLTRIKPFLTPLAGAGLVVVMVLAALFHASRGEFGALPVNVVLGGLAGLVAWGRAKKVPIPAR